MISELSVKQVVSSVDWDCLYRLREAVYVNEENRLKSVDGMSESFDLFNDHSIYHLVFKNGEPVGCAKSINDSTLGLPCDDITDLSEIRSDNKVVEIGHLLVRPDYKRFDAIAQLFKCAVECTAHVFRANYIIADIFVDDTYASRLTFYEKLGFRKIFGPYKDCRFVNSPESMLIGVDIYESHKESQKQSGFQRRLLDHIFDSFRHSAPQENSTVELRKEGE